MFQSLLLRFRWLYFKIILPTSSSLLQNRRSSSYDMTLSIKSWCLPTVASDNPMPNVNKCYPKSICNKHISMFILFLSICLFLCMVQNIVNCKKLYYSRSPDLKYILMWTPHTVTPWSKWKSGQEIFLEKRCPFTNCYLTSRRDFFHDGDLRRFDAIIFNGRNLKYAKGNAMPQQRTFFQKYIFFNLESSDNQPICSSFFDGFFNWTATYKLNSDISLPYMLIRNKNGDEIGPKLDMPWVMNQSAVNETLLQSFNNKTKAAAWFVSRCYTRSKREKYAEKLKTESEKLNLTLDVYGRCGKFVCPRKSEEVCDNLLKNNYYFYLSFENSFAEDYITEKVITALRNDVIPVLYGAANYSRFLPPGSYIDARKHEPKELASLMAQLTRSPETYKSYFKWKNYYTYHRHDYVCSLCAALNNQTMMNSHSEYREFRKWWNPDYKTRCIKNVWGS